MAPPPYPLLAKIGKTSTCSKERRKNKREEKHDLLRLFLWRVCQIISYIRFCTCASIRTMTVHCTRQQYVLMNFTQNCFICRPLDSTVSETQCNDWYGGPTELVQHFVYRGSSYGARACFRHIIALVWLYRSPIPLGRRGVILLVQWLSTCLRGAWGGAASCGRRVLGLNPGLLRLTVRRCNHLAGSHPQSARSHPHSARSHPQSVRSHPRSARSHPQFLHSSCNSYYFLYVFLNILCTFNTTTYITSRVKIARKLLFNRSSNILTKYVV